MTTTSTTRTKKPATPTVEEMEAPFGDGVTEHLNVPADALDTGTTSQQVDAGERKVTFGYTRKKNLGKDAFGQPRFESEEASLYLTDSIPQGVVDPYAWADERAEDAFDLIKRLTWDALDLGYSYNEMGRPSLDGEKPTALTSSVGAMAPPPIPPAPPLPTDREPPPDGWAPPAPRDLTSLDDVAVSPGVDRRPRQGGDQMAQVGLYAERPQFCKQCGNKEFYDNRMEMDDALTNRQKLRPDWKCKSCGKGVFRPGSYEYNQKL